MRQINAYQKVLNQKNKENISYKTFDSIKKYIKDGTNKNYQKQTRLKMLGNGIMLSYLSLEYMSSDINEEISNSINKIVNKIIHKMKEEVKQEFTQDFSDAYIALEEFKKITK